MLVEPDPVVEEVDDEPTTEYPVLVEPDPVVQEVDDEPTTEKLVLVEPDPVEEEEVDDEVVVDATKGTAVEEMGTVE